MGRRSWATPEQLVFLHSYTHELPQAKAGSGLNVLYARVTRDFQTFWTPEPYNPLKAPTATPSRLDELAKVQLYDRVENWYKQFLKKSKNDHSQGPYQKPRTLDLTGRNARKKPPYQLHQAFSVLHWRPKNSPLRREVKDLWGRRQEDAVHELLNPYIKGGGDIASLTRLHFHMSVMQWKCSMLSSDELTTLHDWIDGQQALNGRPWAEEAEACGNDLVAENQHIQSQINNLPLTIQTAIDEIERYTGFRALVLIGGPEPANAGKITTHVYTTGQSIETGLEFPQAWSEFGHTRDSFVEWLRTTYTSDEQKNRSVYTNTPSPTIVDQMSLSPATSLDSNAPPDPNASPGLNMSPSPNTPSDLQYPSANRMNTSPMPAVASPTLNSPLSVPSIITEAVLPLSAPNIIPEAVLYLSAPNITPEVILSLSSDLDITTTDESGIILDDGDWSVPDPGSPTLRDSPQQLLTDSPAIRTDFPTALSQLPVAAATKGVFDIEGVHGSFIGKATIKYWEDIFGGKKWIKMIQSYLDLERMSLPNGRLLRFPSSPRPSEVGDWLKGRKYTKKALPIVGNIRKYRDDWIGWWTASQPKWRSTGSWPFPKGDESIGGWESFPARGPNGIFLAIMATCWWAQAVESAEDFTLFEEVVDDIHWVVQQLIYAHSSPSTADKPQPPPSTSWARTFSRGDGKRKVRPSQRARDTLGFK